MEKKHIVVVLLLNILLLSSCFCGRNSRTVMLDADTSEQIADAHLQQILDGLQTKDREKIKSLFSEQALTDTGDIDAGIDYLFEFFDGEVLRWDNNAGPSVGESINYGHVVKESRCFYDVETDKQKYIIFFLEYTKDTDHPQNVGIYTLRVIKTEDKETELGYWQDMKIAGIYIPEEK